MGVENADACISLEGMSLQEVEKIANDFTIFGRVSPEQKHALVKALKNSGKTVAMTGDGVNDSLALKEADCSIAMADGSEVARNLSNIVLLDSKFSSLPSVVREGRQVINNVQQSSTLFLMKTIFTILLSLLAIVTTSPYPFSPSQLLILEMFVIGLPSVILAIQPNDRLITGNFTTQVLKKALPNGLMMFFNILIVIALNELLGLSTDEYSTVSTLVLFGTGFVNLFFLCLPLNVLKSFCVGLSATLIVFASCFLGKFFGLTECSLRVLIIFVVLVVASIPMHIFAPKFSDFMFDKTRTLKSSSMRKNGQLFMFNNRGMTLGYRKSNKNKKQVSAQKLQTKENKNYTKNQD